MRRGAGCAEAAGGGAGAAAAAGRVVAAAAGGTAATTGRDTGGAAFAAASACLRSRIALSASPGFDTLERSNFGLLSTADLAAVAGRLPLLRYWRTRSAS